MERLQKLIRVISVYIVEVSDMQLGRFQLN